MTVPAPTGPRQIIQLSASVIGGTYPVLFALCDDGSVWKYYEEHTYGYWKMIWPSAPPTKDKREHDVEIPTP